MTSRTFEQILDEASALLRRRRRITLAALRRQLDVDEAYALDVKEELVRGQRVAIEEDGVLVWDGERAPERRQLTVMFCDLVGSAALSEQLDPEELRDVVRAYQTACVDPIRRFEGHVAQYLGDGILSYFGYPAAHEDDASRAVRAALEIVAAIRALDGVLARDKAIHLAVRIAVHTGLVVVGEVGSGERREELAFGEAPNVAARIQALGEPGSVVVSAATHRLVEHDFACVDLGAHPLRGFDEPMRVYRITDDGRDSGRRPHAKPRLSLVGRKEEMERLLVEWDSARAGRGRNVVVSGEPGIGKSRFVEAVRERTGVPGVRRVVFECSPYFINSALHPVAALLRGEIGVDDEAPEGDPIERLERFVGALGFAADETVPYLASLLRAPLGDRYAVTETPARAKRAAHALLVEYLLRMATEGPTVLVWEDLQWADPSTLELLDQFFPRAKEAAVLSLCTTRPEGEPRWRGRADVTVLTLGRLPREDVEALVLAVTAGKEVPPEILRELTTKTDGVPLFVEEITKAVLESTLLEERDGRFVLRESQPPLGIPITLKDSLMARLDRLRDAKHIAQLAAAIGRHFSSDLLATVAGLELPEVARAVDRLVTAGLVHPPPTPDGLYSFKHALIRDIAYESILLSTKRAMHEQIAEAIESRFPALAATQPELLAHHLTQAGAAARAVHHWDVAGQRAAERSDNAEAVAHTTAGIAILVKLPDARTRDAHELTLQIRRAGALRATKGFAAPETGEAYTRARELCERLGDDAQLVSTLNGLYSFHLVRGEYARADLVARELLERAERGGDVVPTMIAHRAVGAVLFHVGRLIEARAHLERALALYDPAAHAAIAYTQGTDHSSTTACFLSLTLWSLGDERAAEEIQTAAIAHAERIGHVHSLAQALTFDCMRLLAARDVDRVTPRAQRLLELSTRSWLTLMAASARFWLAGAKRPRTRAIVDDMRRAAESCWATGAVGYRPLLESMISEAHADIGDDDGAVRFIARAEAHTVESDERWSEPELLRVKARLVLASSREEARVYVAQARAVARAQSAGIWEARLRELD